MLGGAQRAEPGSKSPSAATSGTPPLGFGMKAVVCLLQVSLQLCARAGACHTYELPCSKNPNQGQFCSCDVAEPWLGRVAPHCKDRDLGGV